MKRNEINCYITLFQNLQSHKNIRQVCRDLSLNLILCWWLGIFTLHYAYQMLLSKLKENSLNVRKQRLNLTHFYINIKKFSFLFLLSNMKSKFKFWNTTKFSFQKYVVVLLQHVQNINIYLSSVK